jgi:hypothetical protein
MGSHEMTTKTENLTWYDLLGVAESGLFVTKVESRFWGPEQIVHFIYSPDVEDKSFRIIFKHCPKLHWEYYGEEDEEQDEIADVIGFDFHSDQYDKSVVLHTDLFEVIIHYGTLEVEKNW